MDQDAAYKMIQAYAHAGVSCHMQRTVDDVWDVVIDDHRVTPTRIIHDLETGRAVWRELQGRGLIAA